MSQQSRHDAWRAGDSYDVYMGRWSRLIAPRFLDWLNPGEGLDWLEVGCGTGALTAEVLAGRSPRTFVGIDPSPAFLEQARSNVPDPLAQFLAADAQELPMQDETKDIVVSGLVLNFVPDRLRALREMRRVTRPGGSVAFYVWDYPGGGMEFIDAFWTVAAELDPEAGKLSEAGRFAFCTREDLSTFAATAGLREVEGKGIEVTTTFADFDDLWHPFTLGAGPAPG